MIENNYSQIPMDHTSSKKKVFFLIGGGVFLLLALGIVFFFVLKKDSTSQNTDPESNTPEVTQVTQPVEDPFPLDKDRDGLEDSKEKELGLSNLNFDTDGDGLSDVDEIEVWKTDPKKFDSDSDSFGDGYEVINGYNPAGSGNLQP